MRQGNKKSEKLTNFNKSVGEAYHVSKNGVLTVDVQDEAFRDEFLKQLKKIRSRRELKRRELQAREAARQHA